MKRGVKWKPEQESPWEIPTSFGIPVVYNQHYPSIAEARGLFWNRTIVVGPLWMKLDPRTQRAIVIHEAKHCLAWHREKRLLMLAVLVSPVLLLPPMFIFVAALMAVLYAVAIYYGKQQETEADALAVEQGYGPELLAFVQRYVQDPIDTDHYHSKESRLAAIARAMKERA